MPIILTHRAPVHVSSDSTVMRYMDVGKFFDLISTDQLHFSSLETLREMDPREGLSLSAQGRFEKVDETLRGRERDLTAADHAFELSCNCFVSCWHIGAEERAAMWAVYSRAGAGVAVISSVDALCRALANNTPDIVAGGVRYLDSTSMRPSVGQDAFDVVYRKHKAYCDEREFRLAFTREPTNRPSRRSPASSSPVVGVEAPAWRIPISVRTAVKGVVAAPYLPRREKSLITKICFDYGLGHLLRHSDLCLFPEDIRNLLSSIQPSHED